MTTYKGGEGQDNQKNITTHIKEALLDKQNTNAIIYHLQRK